MQKSISRKDYEVLNRELTDLTQRGELSETQLGRILAGYEVQEEARARLSFIKILVTVGALLIGLGILSLVASNWQALGNLVKFLLIIFLYLGLSYAGYRVSAANPKTGRSLIYIAVLIYGAGIFLIGQMFNFGHHFSYAFVLWGAGALPLAVALRDKVLAVAVSILMLAYVCAAAPMLRAFPLLILPVIPILYYCNARCFGHLGILAFLNNLIVLCSIWVAFHGLPIYGFRYDQVYVIATFFVIGLAMFFAPVRVNQGVWRLQGHLLFGIAGIALTVTYTWHNLLYHLAPKDTSALIITIPFALCFAGLLLYLIRRESLISLVFLCLLIFRYYVDTMYDFLPKSVFFIVSGLLLLGFGWYIERSRKRKGGSAGVDHTG